jgi:hypothetical protein
MLAIQDHVLYMVGTENNACWFSLIAHILFPQRTTQYAYTITLLGLILGTVTPLVLVLLCVP